MQNNSKEVTSNQDGIHRKLLTLVKKHCNSEYQKPYQKHNLQAFELFCQRVEKDAPRGLILDSCCGTAMSSIQLAKSNPDYLVVGIDQSYHRLNKEGVENLKPDNCLLLRANCEDFWRLCVENKIDFVKHYVLYPNPWPKSAHLKRRWHGSPAFTSLNRLAPETELRSNWLLYLEEFSLAWKTLTEREFLVNEFEMSSPLTLFEKKYAASGQKLYQLIVQS